MSNIPIDSGIRNTPLKPTNINQPASGKTIESKPKSRTGEPSLKRTGVSDLKSHFENLSTRQVQPPLEHLNFNSLYPLSRQTKTRNLDRSQLMGLAEQLGKNSSAETSQTDNTLLTPLRRICKSNVSAFTAFTQSASEVRTGLTNELSQLEDRLAHLKNTGAPIRTTRALKNDIQTRSEQLKGLEQLLHHATQALEEETPKTAQSIHQAPKPVPQQSAATVKASAPRYDAIQGLSLKGIDAGRGWTLTQIRSTNTLNADNYTKTFQALGNLPNKQSIMPNAVRSIIKMADETTPKGQKILQLASTLATHRTFIDESLKNLQETRASFASDSTPTQALDEQIASLQAERAGVDHLQSQLDNALVTYARRSGPQDNRLWDARSLSRLTDKGMRDLLNQKTQKGALKLGPAYAKYLKERRTSFKTLPTHSQATSRPLPPTPGSLRPLPAVPTPPQTAPAVNTIELNAFDATSIVAPTTTSPLATNDQSLLTFFERATTQEIAALGATLTERAQISENTLITHTEAQPLITALAQNTQHLACLEDANTYLTALAPLTDAFNNLPETAVSIDYHEALETAKAQGQATLIDQDLIGNTLETAKATLEEVAPLESANLDTAMEALEVAIDREDTPVIIKQEMATFTDQLDQLHEALDVPLKAALEQVATLNQQTIALLPPAPPPPPPSSIASSTPILKTNSVVTDLMASIRARAGQSTLRDASQPLAKAPTPPTITPSQDSLQDTLASSLAKLRRNSREDADDDVDDWDEDDNDENSAINTAPSKKEAVSAIPTIPTLPSSTATIAGTPPPPTFTEGHIPPPPPPPPPIKNSAEATTTISTEERSALLSSITQGKALNKAATHTKVVVVEKRDALLEAIQKGTQLKAVDLSLKKTATGTTKVGGAAGFNMDSIDARAALLRAEEKAEDQTDTDKDDGWDD